MSSILCKRLGFKIWQPLKTNIRQCIAEIPPEMCEKVYENCRQRADGHLNDEC